MAIRKQNVNPVIVAVGRPLAVAGAVIRGVDIRIAFEQRRVLLRPDIGQHNHLRRSGPIGILHQTHVHRTINITAQPELGLVPEIQSPVVVAQKKREAGVIVNGLYTLSSPIPPRVLLTLVSHHTVGFLLLVGGRLPQYTTASLYHRRLHRLLADQSRMRCSQSRHLPRFCRSRCTGRYGD